MTTPPQRPSGPPGSTPENPSPWQRTPPPAATPQDQPAPPLDPPPLPPAEDAGVTAPKKTGWDHKTKVLATVIAVAVAVAVILGIELYVRTTVSDDVNKAASCLIDDGASVSLGPEPVIYQYLSSHFDKITIRTAGNQIKQAKKMEVAITLRNINLQKSGDSLGTIGRADVSVNWPSAGITDSARALMPGSLSSLVDNVTTDGSSGTITLSALGGLARITTKPFITANGLVGLESTNVTAIIGGMPREIVQPALDTFSKGLVGATYPLGLKAQSIQVTNDGVQVNLSSTNQPIKPSTEPCLQNLQH